MRVLVTGSDGYIGTTLVPLLTALGHEVVGLDSHLFGACAFGPEVPSPETIAMDVRDVRPSDLVGFDAVVHLAGLSNDPLGDLNTGCTYDINHHATVRLARSARAAGVERFVFSSSCSLYGASDDALLDERAPMRPVTAYGHSKQLAERDLRWLGDDDFSITFLRNATVYGVSPRIRIDLVVNNLTGHAVASGQTLLKSNGRAWRPLVHVADVAHAFVAVLEAPRDKIHGEAFNVGRTRENYRVSDVAEIVSSIVPESRVLFATGASADARCYRVNCDKFADAFPGAVPQWTVRDGVFELMHAYRTAGLVPEDLTGPRYLRVAHIRQLLEDERLDADLRWRTRQLVAHA